MKIPVTCGRIEKIFLMKIGHYWNTGFCLSNYYGNKEWFTNGDGGWTFCSGLIIVISRKRNFRFFRNKFIHMNFISETGVCCRKAFLEAHNATAITCYECNSEYDPRCGDPFDNYTLGTINCDAKTGLDHLPHLNATLCRKTTQKVYGKVRVVRGCGYVTDVRDNGDCMKRLGTHDVQALYCSCTSELCNGGITRKPFGMLMIDSKNLFINSLPLIFITIFIISNCNQIVNNL